MTMGEDSYKLEKKLQKSLGVKHVVLTTSGTSALMMATIASEIKPFDLVYAPNYTWIASVNPARIIGAKIKLVDSLPESEIINFELLNKQIKKNPPKLVVLTHLNGQANFNEEFDNLKKKYNFFVIEDAAQALFSRSDKKILCGTKYDIGCFSLSITKPINMVYGGFCTTNSTKLYKKLIAIRNNGVNAEPENAKLELPTELGLNLKPSDLHSSIGLINLNSRAKRIKNLKKIFDFYKKNINNQKLKFSSLKGNYTVPCYPQVLVNNRKKFVKYCEKNNIGLHLGIRCLSKNKDFSNSNNKNLKNSIKFSDQVVRLPSGPGYQISDLKKIVRLINKF
tara:strand:+ start:4066 stop:5076 length:1011 start_codon:yes stop_codon:yes gene_type:complete